MNQKLIIFAPFHYDFEPLSGTSIRIAGYTKAFNELNVDYTFFSPAKPNYVPFEKYVVCRINRKLHKIFIIHNLLYANVWLRPISYLLRLLLINLSGIKGVIDEIQDRLIWTHQEYTLALFLYFVYRFPFIYDIHGILELQREYYQDLSKYRRLWFYMNLKNEKVVLRFAPYINVVSLRMKKFVEEKYRPMGTILLAPDGVPDSLWLYEQVKPNILFKNENGLSGTDKIIMYAGSFKKFGGVTELVKVFLSHTELNTHAVLLLVGTGQEAKRVNKLIENASCKNRIFYFRSLAHNELIAYMKIADAIVCPDLAGNLYNEITPHIKLYDAIASGRNVVSTDFEVNKELFNPKNFNIYYFSYDKKNSFRDALLSALQNEIFTNNNHLLENMTYTMRAKMYMENFKS